MLMLFINVINTNIDQLVFQSFFFFPVLNPQLLRQIIVHSFAFSVAVAHNTNQATLLSVS